MPPTAMALEFGFDLCTDQLAGALRRAGVSVIRSAQPTGMHLWSFWREELIRSMPTLRNAIGS
jgi:diacylglycerol O-acyltransferase / trehalose O-mycolyltransferase